MKKLILLTILLTACSHHEKLKKDHIISGRCEEEFNKVKLSPGEEIWPKFSEASGTGTSYLVTGLGYSTDFIVRFSGGLIGSLAVCSPLLALEVAGGSSNNNVSGECLGKVGLTIYESIDPKIGPSMKRHTEKWKCPNLDHISKGLLKVAECYYTSGETALARQQLRVMQFRRSLNCAYLNRPKAGFLSFKKNTENRSKRSQAEQVPTYQSVNGH